MEALRKYIDLIIIYWDTHEDPVPRWRERLSVENQHVVEQTPVTVLWIPYYAN